MAMWFIEPPGIRLSFGEDLVEALLEAVNVFHSWAREDELDERGLPTIDGTKFKRSTRLLNVT